MKLLIQNSCTVKDCGAFVEVSDPSKIIVVSDKREEHPKQSPKFNWSLFLATVAGN